VRVAKKAKKNNLTNYFCLFIFFGLIPFCHSIELTLVTENLPPFQMRDDNNKITGFATQIVQAALYKTSYSYHFEMYSWARAYNIAQKKQNTCIFSIARTKEREHLFKWVAPIATTNSYFIGLKSNKNIKLATLNDAKNYITAVFKDDVTYQILIKNGFIEFKNYYVINNSDSLLKLLYLRKNIDLILIDDLTLAYRAKLDHLDPNLFKAYLKLNRAPLNFYVACSNTTSKQVINKLRTAIFQLKKSGEDKKIIEKWLSNKKVLFNE